jgi:hypothetical protein
MKIKSIMEALAAPGQCQAGAGVEFYQEGSTMLCSSNQPYAHAWHVPSSCRQAWIAAQIAAPLQGLWACSSRHGCQQ